MREKASQLVWFFGQSAAGKARLIRKVEGEKSAELLKLLRVEEHTLLVCEVGFKRPGTRQELVNDICAQLKDTSNVALLVKGQTDDLLCGRPEEVKRRLPMLVHRIVFISCHPDEVYRRWQRQPGRETLPREGAPRELKNQLDLVSRLANEFEITCIEATTEEYRARGRLPYDLV